VESAKKKVIEEEAARTKASTDVEATQKKVEKEAKKEMATMQQKTDTAYKLLSRFNLLHEVVANTPSTTTTQESIVTLQQAIRARDTGAAKVLLDLRSRTAKPLHEVFLAFHVPVKAVVIGGVTNGTETAVHGTYLPFQMRHVGASLCSKGRTETETPG